MTNKALFQTIVSHNFQKQRSSLKMMKVDYVPLSKSMTIVNEQPFFQSFFDDNHHFPMIIE